MILNHFCTLSVTLLLWLSLSSVLWAQEADEVLPLPEISTSEASSVLIKEAWHPHRAFIEWGIPSAGFDLSYQVSQDWAIDLGLGLYDPFTIGSYLNLSGRYYLPESWTEDMFAFRVSRFYWEGMGRIGFQLDGSNARQFGFGSALGLESRWGDLITRVGVQFDKGFNGRQQEGISVFPVLGVGYEIPWTSQSAYSETYLAQKAQFLKTQLGPLIEFYSGGSSTQGANLGFMVTNAQVGIGFYKGRDRNRRGTLTEETLGLFGRYYFSPIHPGLQSYIEGVSNFQGDTRFTARMGIEHREAWGGVVNLSLGMGAEKPHDKSDYGVIFDISSSFGYYWSLSSLGIIFDPQQSSSKDAL